MWDASTNDASMNLYIQEKMRADTALEINENNQSTYTHDVLYLVFKLLMFVILGLVFYYLFKNQNPEELVNQVKEKAAAASNIVDQAAKAVKEKIK
jgi:phosphotransferase system  glucose/maltose/N-acetylglucosamine-specific IIC component